MVQRETTASELINLQSSDNDDAATEPAARSRIADLLRKPFDIRSLALTGLFVLALFYTIYFARGILLPLVLSLLLSYLLRPVIRAMARVKIIPPIGAALVLISLIAILGYGMSALATPVAGWLEKAPYSISQLQWKLSPLKQPMQKVAQASGEIEK